MIKAYCRKAGYNSVICFSSGPAALALRSVGLDVLWPLGAWQDLGYVRNRPRPKAADRRGCWRSPAWIRATYPGRFDATPGHLPLHLMVQIAAAYRRHLGRLPDACYYVPTGSGETVICLQIAYPERVFVPVYRNRSPHTRYDPRAPLNPVVKALFRRICFY